MTEKSLGQIAHDAHYKTLVPSPEVMRDAFWKTAEPLVRDAWQAAAKAVLVEMRSRYANEPRLQDNWLEWSHQRYLDDD